jgi:hypothetical protein
MHWNYKNRKREIPKKNKKFQQINAQKQENMSNINIRRDVNDKFYRYKMPKIISKIEGKGISILPKTLRKWHQNSYSQHERSR